MYWRGPLFMSRRLLNAFSIDDVMALKSLYNKRPHGSPSDFTDVCTSETLDEHTGFFREAKRSFVLSHEETQRNSVIKKGSPIRQGVLSYLLELSRFTPPLTRPSSRSPFKSTHSHLSRPARTDPRPLYHLRRHQY